MFDQREGYCEKACLDCPVAGKDPKTREVVDLMVRLVDPYVDDTLPISNQPEIMERAAETLLEDRGAPPDDAAAVVAAVSRTIVNQYTVCPTNYDLRVGG